MFFLPSGKLPVLKITVTPQISSDTFRSIWKNSKKSSITHKKKKKVCFWLSMPVSSSHQGALYGAWYSVGVDGATSSTWAWWEHEHLRSKSHSPRPSLYSDGWWLYQGTSRKRTVQFSQRLVQTLLPLFELPPPTPATPPHTHMLVPLSLLWVWNGEFILILYEAVLCCLFLLLSSQ